MISPVIPELVHRINPFLHHLHFYETPVIVACYRNVQGQKM